MSHIYLSEYNQNNKEEFYINVKDNFGKKLDIRAINMNRICPITFIRCTGNDKKCLDFGRSVDATIRKNISNVSVFNFGIIIENNNELEVKLFDDHGNMFVSFKTQMDIKKIYCQHNINCSLNRRKRRSVIVPLLKEEAFSKPIND